MSTVGFVVNPLAGKDIRRLVAHASSSTDRAKVARVGGGVIAAVDAGATRIVLAPDHRGLTTAGVAALDLPATVEVLDLALHAQRRDTTDAARGLQAAGVDVVVSLGGDGTQRDVALGWLDAPLVPVSTGTNNAFPLLVDATLAGAAAGLVASSAVDLDEVAITAKVLNIDLAGGSTRALVDVVLVDERFTGSRAVWRAESLRTIVAALADPAALGLSSVAGRTNRALQQDDRGVVVECSPTAAATVRAPIVPGALTTVGVVSSSWLELGEVVEVAGPGVLALDGERHVVLDDGPARVTLKREGPRVIDPWETVRLASARGVFSAGF